MAILNMVFGGAKAVEAYAYIRVYYNAGCVCTCSDGTTTLTAPDTSGAYVFGVPNAGTWTITATDAYETVTTAVSVTYQYQLFGVYAMYKLLWGSNITESDWSFVSKGYNSTYTTGYAPSHSVSSGVLNLYESSPSSGIRGGLSYFTNSVDLTPFSSLEMTGTISSGDTADDGCGLKIYSSIGTYLTSNVVAQKDAGRSSTVTNPTINIMSLTGSHYIGISLITKNGATTSTRGRASVTKLVLKS